MSALKKLQDATDAFLESVKVINEQISAEIWEQEPLITHQKFCRELVQICKKEENQNKTPAQIPEAMKILTAIEVLEELYPKLKNK